MTRLAIALLLSTTAATAAPLTPWEPGASPCAGACSWEWARAQTGAPAGEPRPLTIPAGTPIEWMSYAKKGKPFGILYHGRPTLRPLAAMGYPIGGGLWIGWIAECENMVTFYLPAAPGLPLLSEAGVPEAATPPPPRQDRPRLTPPTGPLPPIVVRVPPLVPPTEPPGVTPEPEPPAPIPLPAGIWLMLAALGLLGLMRRRRG